MKKQIRNWILALCHEPYDNNEIVALNFGIYEIESGYCLYLTGAKTYDASNDDWACSIDYEPQINYLTINSKMKWKQFLSVIYMIISDYLNDPQISKSLIFNNKVVTIGFDDGQLLRIK